MSDLVFDDKPPTSFWIFGGAALVWNLIGLVAYISTVMMPPEALAKMTEDAQQFYTSTPAWATGAFALAVTSGVVGSLLLLLRKAWAVPLFVVSLLSVIVQNVDAFILRDAFGILGINSVILPSLVFVVAVLLLIYSRSCKENGWLN
ncbi:MAG: hypothetical protein P8X81_04860 [Woeseiaceae bacterium]|jgi:hypothetical protein